MIRRLLWIFGTLIALAVLGGVAFWARPVEFFNTYSELRLLRAGAESRSTLVEGYRVHYYALGPDSGPAVVLVHGLGGRAENWQNLAPYLSKAGYRVYLPDLLGYGQSEKPAGFSYSVPDEVGVVVGFLDALGLKQVDLGGWSMGGWIVQRVAAEHPERVRKLILFDSAGLALKPDWNTNLFTPATADELSQLDELLMPHPPNVPDFVATDILRRSKQNAWVIHRALASMLTGHDATDRLLPGLKMPALIVWGELDRITPINEGETMHKLISGSQLEVIQGCGHLAPSQCAPQIGPNLVVFLRR
ncbi:MAG TPA: alpha/beta fold hydrolase [Terracidiphilus sp.]|nr:alpha/beta fold hydrolase [Terracidiphilus sp.]